MATSITSAYNIARFGAEVVRESPRQANVIVVSGTVLRALRRSVPDLCDSAIPDVEQSEYRCPNMKYEKEHLLIDGQGNIPDTTSIEWPASGLTARTKEKPRMKRGR
jgi:hypothetical protein